MSVLALLAGLVVTSGPAGAQPTLFGDFVGDTTLGLADIVTYGADYQLSSVHFQVKVLAPENPATSAAWHNNSFIGWGVYTSPVTSGSSPLYVVALIWDNTYGFTWGVINWSTRKAVCVGDAGYDGTWYTADVSSSCIGNPPIMYIDAEADILVGSNEYFDLAPTGGTPRSGPIYAGSVPPQGNLDSVSSPDSGHVRATGWTRDPDTPNQANNVAVYVDGTSAGQFPANVNRPDVGNHGFDVTVPAGLGPHQVCAYGLNNAPGLQTPLGCLNVTVVNQSPVGVFESALWSGATSVAVAGWALDPDAGTSAIDVGFGFPMPVATSLTANQPRADVAASYPSSGPNHGYAGTLTVPSNLSQICASAQNKPTVVGDTGTSVGCLVPRIPAPTNVSAVAGLESATVSWTPNTLNPPGTPRTGFEVVVQPGGAVKSVPAGATSTTVEGLTGGQGYTFTVRTRNDGGAGPDSAPSASVTPTGRPGAGFHPVTPFRALDSRSSVGGFGGPVGGGQVKDLTVTGVGGVPSGATAVVMNVTVTGATAGSYLTVFPAGGAVPTAANLNFAPGQSVPNLVTAKIGAGGAVSFFNAVGDVHVVADVVGYYDDGSPGGEHYAGLAPVRVLDSRGPTGGWANTPLGPNQSRAFTVAGANGVPTTATGVVMNVTVTGGTAPSYLQAYPSGAAQPVTANLLFGGGQTTSNLVTVKIGADKKVALYNQVGSVHVIVDVVGYFDAAAPGLFHSVAPVRLLDSRGSTGGWAGVIGPGVTRNVPVAGVSGISPSATAVVANLVAVQPTAGTFLTAFPAGGSVPLAASLLAGPGQIVPNLTSTALGSGGQISIFNQVGSMHVVLDAAGYYASS